MPDPHGGALSWFLPLLPLAGKLAVSVALERDCLLPSSYTFFEFLSTRPFLSFIPGGGCFLAPYPGSSGSFPASWGCGVFCLPQSWRLCPLLPGRSSVSFLWLWSCVLTVLVSLLGGLCSTGDTCVGAQLGFWPVPWQLLVTPCTPVPPGGSPSVS